MAIEKQLKRFSDGGKFVKEDGGYYFYFEGYGYFVKGDENFKMLFAWMKQKKYDENLGKYIDTDKDLFDFIQGGCFDIEKWLKDYHKN